MTSIHNESSVRLASRDLRALVTSTVRFYVWGVAVSATVAGVTTVLSWGHKEGAQIAIGVGALLVGSGIALLVPFAFYLVTAPYHQRDAARSELQTLVRQSEADKQELRRELEAATANRQVDAIAAILGTELRDIRTKIERVKSTKPASYPFGFQLPAARFTEYESVLAKDRRIYEVVSRAYTAAHHVNEMLNARESRRREGNRQPLAAIPEDGLDEAHGAAGEALDVLGEPHNQPFRTGSERSALGLDES